MEPVDDDAPKPTTRPPSVAPLGDFAGEDGPTTTSTHPSEGPLADFGDEVRPRPMRAASVGGRGPVAAEIARDGNRAMWLLVVAAVAVVAVGSGAVLLFKRSSTPAPAPSTTNAAVEPTPTAQRTELVCDAARQRLYAGAPLGLDVAGWVVELWLGRDRGDDTLAGDPALAGALGSARAELNVQGGPDAEIVPEGGAAGGVLVRFGGSWVPRFFDPDGRERFVTVGERLATAAGADHAALFARCAHRQVRDVGVWYMGRDEPRAIAALLYASGAHADPAAVDLAKLGPQKGTFAGLAGAAARLDHGAVEEALKAAGGRIQKWSGAGVVLRFPFGGPTRAARVSRDLAPLAGL